VSEGGVGMGKRSGNPNGGRAKRKERKKGRAEQRNFAKINHGDTDSGETFKRG